MLPLIPIIAAATSAAILIHRKFKRTEQKSNFKRLIEYVKSKNIPVSDEDNFNPDAMLPDGTPILFDVMSTRELFISLLDYGANPNICNTKGTPAIIYASTRPIADDKVDILLKYGAYPDALDSEGKTAIFYTTSRQVLELLYRAGADFNTVDCTGKTAIFYSFANNTTRALTLLGANVNARDAEGKTAVFYARFAQEFQKLNDAGADFDAKDNYGKTALHYSLMNNTTRELVNNGAYVNAVDNEGKNLVFYASVESELDMLKDLGADFNVIDNTGKTPLFYSFRKHNTLALVKRGANVKAKDRDDKTVFFYLNGTNDFSIVEKLEEYGLDIKSKDKYGQKSNYYKRYKKYKGIKNKGAKPDLYEAINSNNIQRVKLLLDLGADPNIWDKTVTDWTMVHLAVYKKSPEMIELLVKAGADINRNRDGIPPLSKAVYDKDIACFKKLLELGANPELSKNAVEYSGTYEMKRIFLTYINK